MIIADDNDNQSIISKIDPDLNILYCTNDTIKNSMPLVYTEILFEFKHIHCLLSMQILGP